MHLVVLPIDRSSDRILSFVSPLIKPESDLGSSADGLRDASVDVAPWSLSSMVTMIAMSNRMKQWRINKHDVLFLSNIKSNGFSAQFLCVSVVSTLRLGHCHAWSP